MGGCESDRVQERGDSRDGAGEGGSLSKGERGWRAPCAPPNPCLGAAGEGRESVDSAGSAQHLIEERAGGLCSFSFLILIFLIFLV